MLILTFAPAWKGNPRPPAAYLTYSGNRPILPTANHSGNRRHRVKRSEAAAAEAEDDEKKLNYAVFVSGDVSL